MVMGEGNHIGVDHLVKLGLEAKIAKPRIAQIIDQTRSALTKWPDLALQYGVGQDTAHLIAKRICS